MASPAPRCILLMVFTPFMVVAVNEFRPDLAVAFFTAAAVFCAVSGAFAESGERAKRYARIGGCLLGAALLAKPSFFLHTALMGFCAMGVLLAGRIYAEKGSSANRGTVWRAAVEFIGLALLMALPYYLLSWQHVINYFWNNAVSADSDVWKIKGNLFNTVDFYLVSGPAAAMTGAFAFLYCALIGLGIVVRLVQAGMAPGTCSCIAERVCRCITWGNVAGSYEESVFWPFLSVHPLFHRSRRTCLPLEITLVPLSRGRNDCCHGVRAIPERSSPSASEKLWLRLTLTRNSANDKILTALQDAVVQTKPPPQRNKVFVTFAGNVNSSSLRLGSEKKACCLNFFDYPRSNDLDSLQAKRFKAVILLFSPRLMQAAFTSGCPRLQFSRKFVNLLMNNLI